MQTILTAIPCLREAQQIRTELINVSANEVYGVEAGGQRYILRLEGDQYGFMGLSKVGELEAVTQAAEMGLAPKILAAGDGYLLMERIEGPLLDWSLLRQPAVTTELAALLKAIHRIHDVDRQLDVFAMLDRYLSGMKRLAVPHPPGLDELLAGVPAMEDRWRARKTSCLGYSHNDFFPFNLIQSTQGIRLIDWELSGYGDVLFDLSTLSFTALYSEAEDEVLLSSYFGIVEPELRAGLRDMKVMNMLRDIGWSLLHAGLSPEWAEGLTARAEKAIRLLRRGHLHFWCDCPEMG